MQSKAFDKLVSRRPGKRRLSKTLRHFSIKISKECCVYVPYRNHMVENIHLSDRINIVHINF